MRTKEVKQQCKECGHLFSPLPLVQLFKNIAFSGLKKNSKDIEAQRLVLVTNLYCIVGFLYLVLFSIRSYLNSNWDLVYLLGIAATFAIANIFYLRKSGNYKLSGNLIVIVMVSICFYLLSSGGIENTGPLWSYTLPPLILFIYGLSIGGTVLVIYMLASLALLFIPDNGIMTAAYTYVFKVRYLSTFLVVCVISSICEYSRYHSYTLLKRLQKSIQLEAHTDELTGLYNRRYMYEQIDRVIDKVHRYKRPYSMLLCDLDHFKSINDNYGHSCGDQVLIETANRMKDVLRSEDIAARWGGEEFLFILPETGAKAAFLVAEKLRQRLCDQVICCTNEQLSVSMSIGVLQIQEGDDLEGILNNVDDALYEAKRDGRNTVKLFKSTQNKKT